LESGVAAKTLQSFALIHANLKQLSVSDLSFDQ